MEQTASANGRFILPKASTTSAATPDTNDTQPVQQPTTCMAELTNSLPDIMTVPPLEHNNSSTSTMGPEEIPSTTVTVMPSCRFETRASNQLPQLPPKCMAEPNEVPRESCAVREKQKALERLILKPNIHVGDHSYTSHTSFQSPPPPPPPTATTSVVNIPTSTLVTNLANSILVNVLQNNMLEAAANNATAIPHRGTLHSTQPSKPTFVHVDDLLVKQSPKDNYCPSRQLSSFPRQVREERRPIRIGPLISQLHPTEASTTTSTHSISFNPNHFLTNTQAMSPHYSHCSTVLCQPTSLNVKTYTDSQRPHSPPKRPRLE